MPSNFVIDEEKSCVYYDSASILMIIDMFCPNYVLVSSNFIAVFVW